MITRSVRSVTVAVVWRSERRGEEINNDVVDRREVTETDTDKCSCPSPARPSSISNITRQPSLLNPRHHRGLNQSL